MSRLFIVAFILSLLTAGAFGKIEQLLQLIASGFGGGSNFGLNANLPRSGFGIRTPSSEFSIGYGLGR
ncbi:uncharacterized protein LOC108022265 [Drosophila biarmipes]|uniref:uncharacterized protein LOC108022265 n=1 Tax=Drosophila biarmipes TaxID=125945 RepID=UPI0007E6C30A|nr:uncharacterized protein LOC108022265 [Drosophila biarmipes]